MNGLSAFMQCWSNWSVSLVSHISVAIIYSNLTIRISCAHFGLSDVQCVRLEEAHELSKMKTGLLYGGP